MLQIDVKTMSSHRLADKLSKEVNGQNETESEKQPDYKSKDSQSNSKRNSIVKQKERVAHETKSENETLLQKKKGRRSN